MNTSSYAKEDEITSSREPSPPRNGILDEGGREASKKKKKAENLPGIENAPISIPYHSLYRYSDPLDLLLLLLGIAGSGIGGAVLPCMSILLGSIIDEIGKRKTDLSSAINYICLWFLILGIIAFFAAWAEQTCWMWHGLRQANRIKVLFFNRILHQEISFFDASATSGGLLTSLNEDTVMLQDGLGEKIGTFVHHATAFVVGFAIGFWRDWRVALVMCGLIPVIMGAGVITGSYVKRLRAKASDAYGLANNTASEVLGNIRTVASFNGQGAAAALFRSLLVYPTRMGIKIGLPQGVMLGIIQMMLFGGYAACFLFGGWLAYKGEITGGVVMNVLFATLIGGFSIAQAAPYLVYFGQAQSAGAKIFAIIDRKSKIDSAEATGAQPRDCPGEIEFKGVRFAYPSRPNVIVFENFNLTVPAGHSVALVGESGSGKSTVIGLLERFYDPLQGQVLLDGLDLRQIKLTWLRDRVGLVSQEPALFATTIYENVAFGNPNATPEQIDAALKAANAWNFIQRLPDKLETMVGERGVSLSGGQKQRIAIARAVLKNPRILLLDEATSALDAESERVVQEALDKLMVGRTTIVVAHRLSTVRHANTIAVVQRGTIIEMGSHDTLVNKEGGAYAALVQMQTKQQEEKEEERRLRKALASGSGGHKLSRDVETSAPTPSAPPASHQVKVDVDAVAILNLDRSLTSAADSDTKKKKKGTGKDLSGAPVKVTKARLFKLVKPDLPYFILGIFTCGILGLTMPAFAFSVSGVLPIFYKTNRHEILTGTRIWALVFFIVGMVSFTCASLQQYAFNLIGQNLACRLREAFFAACLRMEVGYFDEEAHNSGALVGRLASDTMYVRGAITDQVGMLIQLLVTIFTSYIIALVTGWKLALVMMAALPLLVSGGKIRGKFMSSGFESGSDKLFAKANTVALDSISNARVIAAFGLEDRVTELFERYMVGPAWKIRKTAIIVGVAFGYSHFVMFGTYALSWWYGGHLVRQHEMTFEAMLRVFFSVLVAAIGAMQAQLAFPDIGKAKSAVAHVFEVLDRRSLIDAESEEGAQPAEVHGDIEFRDVKFSYPSRPNVPVFEDFNLKIPAGHTVALVGESGSGKSTVIGLLERFYDPLQGQVLLDGLDLRQIKLTWLRDRVGLVSQEPALFATSIRANVLYGKPDASDEEIEGALKAANAWNFVQRLPDKLDTMAGERGVSLSGGQKQRIAIARAVLKNPRILLLDEATSALDAESERVVQEALDKLMVGRTTIVVAHRLSTVRHANTIAVVQRGSIIEMGSHDELANKEGGAYAALIKLQRM